MANRPREETEVRAPVGVVTEDRALRIPARVHVEYPALELLPMPAGHVS
jgi:hypothetical protein